MSKTIADLYYSNLAIAHEQQTRLKELIAGEETYTVNFKTRELKFGSGLGFCFAILGSESFEENSWLWGWANENLKQTGIDVEKSEYFKKYGIENNVETFVHPMLQLGGGWSANELALISLGISEYSAYFRYPQQHGAYYLMLETNTIMKNTQETDLVGIRSCYTDCWALYDDGSHIDILKYYLLRKGVPFSIANGSLNASVGSQNLICEFDEGAHATRIEVTL